MGVKVEVIKGSEPIDVMNHLGKRSGYHSVVWRAGCWYVLVLIVANLFHHVVSFHFFRFRGSRGVDAIMKGAFQRVSAHLAVDAVGGKSCSPYWF